MDGGRHWMNVANYTREDITKWIELMRTQIHDSAAVRRRKLWHTEFPSIQGPWTPFYFKNPEINLAQFPNVTIFYCKQQNPCISIEKSDIHFLVTAVEKIFPIYQYIISIYRKNLVQLLNWLLLQRNNLLNCSKLNN